MQPEGFTSPQIVNINAKVSKISESEKLKKTENIKTALSQSVPATSIEPAHLGDLSLKGSAVSVIK